MIKDCKKLVASRELCERLQNLGVRAISYFHYFKNETAQDGEFWDLGRVLIPGKDTIPAFGVPELDIMLGNKWDRPRLPKVQEITVASDPLAYIFHYSNRQTTFINMADAYADLVCNLIHEQQLRVEEVNIRLHRIFLGNNS